MIIKWFEKHGSVSWSIVVLIAGFIFWVSSIETFPVSISGFPWKSITYHIGIFFLLCGFLLVAMVRGRGKDFIFPAVLLAFGYAISDEIHQFFVPGRHCSFGDIFLDSVGIIFAVLIYGIILAWRENAKKIN